MANGRSAKILCMQMNSRNSTDEQISPKSILWTFILPELQLFVPRNTGIATQMMTFATTTKKHLSLLGQLLQHLGSVKVFFSLPAAILSCFRSQLLKSSLFTTTAIPSLCPQKPREVKQFPHISVCQGFHLIL